MMFRLSTFVALALIASAFVFSVTTASPAVSDKQLSESIADLFARSVEIPEGAHNKDEQRSIVDVTSHQVNAAVHAEVPEGTFEPDADVVNVTERATAERSSTKTHDDSVTQISVDEFKTTPTALAQAPSAKSKLPTTSRIWYGRFTGYSFFGTRCYAFPSYIIHARYINFRGYNCYRKIYFIRNYICVRAVCKALISYWRH